MATKRKSSYARKLNRSTLDKVSATKHGKTIVRANGKVVNSGSKTQEIYSQSQYILKERYLSPKGKRLLEEAKQSLDSLGGSETAFKSLEKLIWTKYGKNRYILNPNARVIKTIVHSH